ncbi:glycosyltransferase family 2 protein [Metabacillus litoralis]|uniref:glycosyltransferase family 2 protein n=1 Tax=Metabacillus litoralis TaxID=152268 RepID=UPI0020403CE3|nr:glycosyltransferase family 2 protein [Metabacillus litoralis]MCM3409749.1 glycosyltransferase family 2 protein [Metabacillus litoralis]
MFDVTVVIPLYNKEHYIKRAVQSVLSQTIQTFEIVIIDDGSTDNSYNKVAEIGDPRIRVIQQKNAGASAARNRGIEEAKTDLIAFLDADDEWKPTFLETVFRLIEKYPVAGAYATAYQIILKNGRKITPIIESIPKTPWEGLIRQYSKCVLRDLPVISSGVIVPKKTFEKVGLFAINHHHGEDQDMWFRISIHDHIAYSHTNQVTYYRGLPNSMCTILYTPQPYPIIETIKNIIESKEVVASSELKEYLVKLELDYADRLIKTNRFKEGLSLVKGISTKRYKVKKLNIFLLYLKQKLLKALGRDIQMTQK